MAETSSKWRINSLCVLGLIVGLIALFLPWNWDIFGNSFGPQYMLHGIGADTGLYDAFNIFSYLWQLQSPLFVSMLLLYVIGLIVDFISPIGGLIQIASATLAQIVGEMPLWGGNGLIFMHPGESIIWNNWFPFGELLGVYSGMIVVASMLRPIGPGYANRAIGIREKLLTFGRYRAQPSASAETEKKNEGVLGSISSCLRRTGITMRTFLIVIVPVVLIILVFLYYLQTTQGATLHHTWILHYT